LYISQLEMAGRRDISGAAGLHKLPRRRGKQDVSRAGMLVCFSCLRDCVARHQELPAAIHSANFHDR
jgi:hypothetical protein